MTAPTMPEIRQTIQQARDLTGREDTNEFAVEAPRMLARLLAILDLYVGREPTLADEAAYVRSVGGAEMAAELARLFEDRGRSLLDGGIMTSFDVAGLIREHLAGRLGKDTDGAQAPAGGSTQGAPDLTLPWADETWAEAEGEASRG